MSRKVNSVWVVITIAAVLLTGCSGGTEDTTPTVDANTQLTAVGATVQAELTRSALLTPSATNTLEPTATIEPTSITPTVDPATQGTVAATIAPTVPAATVSSLPDKAEFVSDVTVPDGTKYAPGTAFTKTWRLKNTGTTTWTTAYQVRYYAGDAMGSSSSKAVPNEVAPGATVDISIDLKAPSTAGSYQTTFVLSNAEGYNFSNFYVLIEVTGSTSATNTPTDDNDDDDDDDKTQTPAPTATEVVVPTETPSS